MEKFFLNARETGLLIIDVQEKLAAVMKYKEQVVQNCRHLIEAAAIFQVPLLLTEQYPKGLGTTVPEIQEILPEYAPLVKTSFDCCREPGFLDRVSSTGRRKWILTGMETHVCILQTALGLMKESYTVQVVQDAVCSRTKKNFKAGIEFMRDAGAVITSTETVLFQLLGKAGGEPFKILSQMIK
ncbi:MAG: hydrolase [Thermodesulfobacteriota bacterium]